MAGSRHPPRNLVDRIVGEKGLAGAKRKDGRHRICGCRDKKTGALASGGHLCVVLPMEN